MSRAFPSLDPPVEAALVARARSLGRDRDAAFAEIFRIFREPVLTLCFHVTGQLADAEDVVQQTFLSVHGALPLFRQDSRLSTWIYRIAIRAALVARARRRTVEALDPALPGASTEHELMVRDEARRVAVAMDRLSAEHRTVLSLFAVDGLSHKAIADILGIAEGTVWSRLNGARRKLNEELAARA